jgi:hypothetical protein
LFSGGVFVIVFRLLLDCVRWLFGGYSLGVFPAHRDGRQRWAEDEIAKRIGNEKRKLFCPIAFRWGVARFHFTFKPRGPTFPDVFIPLGLAISSGKQNDARRYSAGGVSETVQNSSKTKLLPDCVWVV